MQETTRDIEKYTHAYMNKEYGFEEAMVAFRRKKVLEILQSYSPKSILEIGCGIHSISNYFYDYEKFVIVEPSPLFATKAKEDSKEDQRITVLNDYVENCINKLGNEHFDCILLSGLLHEVVQPDEFLRSIVTLCGENTLLHINVPNARSFHLLWAYKSGLIESLGNLSQTAKTLQQHTAFDMQSLHALAGSCGLDIKESGSYFIKPFNHAKMSILCSDHGGGGGEPLITQELLLGLYEMTEYMPDLGAEIFINCIKHAQGLSF